MVPFPDEYGLEASRDASAKAVGTIARCCPDWHGLVMPPLREDAKRDTDFWYRVYWPDPHSAENNEERWKIAALRVMMGTLLAKKYGTDRILTRAPTTAALKHTMWKPEH